MNTITRDDLIELRKLRLCHLRYGIGCIDNKERYLNLLHTVGEYIKGLTGEERDIMELYYIHGRSEVWMGMYLYCSDRHIRRVKKKILDSL